MKRFTFFVLLSCFLLAESKSIPNDINEQPEYYYKLGCKNLKRKKIEEAEEYFLSGAKASFKVSEIINYHVQDKKYYIFDDLENVEKAPKKNNWQLYYYKGLLEFNLYILYNNYLSYKKLSTNAIESLKQSIDLYDNYQSHMLLSLMVQSEVEKKKAIKLALANGEKKVASKIETSIAYKSEKADNLEEALSHYEKALEYDYDEWTEKKVNEITEKINSVKAQGFKSYADYQLYNIRKEKEERQKKERASWNNLSTYLSAGGYARTIPIEKGDIIDVPLVELAVADVAVVQEGYSYLVTAYGFTGISNCCYIISPRQITFGIASLAYGQQTLRIQCQGTASYKSGYNILDTYVFVVIE